MSEDQAVSAPAVDVAALRAALERATPGRWQVEGHFHGADGCRCFSCDDLTECWYVDNDQAEDCEDNIARRSAVGEVNEFGRPLRSCSEGPFLKQADAELIVLLRNNAEALLDALAEAERRGADAGTERTGTGYARRGITFDGPSAPVTMSDEMAGWLLHGRDDADGAVSP